MFITYLMTCCKDRTRQDACITKCLALVDDDVTETVFNLLGDENTTHVPYLVCSVLLVRCLCLQDGIYYECHAMPCHQQ